MKTKNAAVIGAEWHESNHGDDSPPYIEPQVRGAQKLRLQLDQFDYSKYEAKSELRELDDRGRLVETDYFPRVLREMFPNLAMGVGGNLYNWSHGSWYPILRKDNNLDFVTLALQAAELQGKRVGGLRWLRHVTVKPTLIRDITARLVLQPGYLRLDEKPPIDRVNLLNGIYDVSPGTKTPKKRLSPSRRDFMSPLQFQFAFDPKAKCPTWDQFFKDNLKRDTFEAGVLWEIMGWLMVPYTELQKAVMLYGPTNSGKSTFINRIKTLFGQASPDRSLVEYQSLQALSRRDNYANANLLGKLVNVCGDLPSEDLPDLSVFKAITGEDTIPARMIFKDPIVFTPYVRLLFSKNPPHVQARGAGQEWYGRWIVIDFPVERPGPSNLPIDKKLKHKLEAELPGAMVKALAGLTRVLDREDIFETDSMKASLLEMKESGPDQYLINILRESLAVNAAGWTLKEDVVRILNRNQRREEIDDQRAAYLMIKAFDGAVIPFKKMVKKIQRPAWRGVSIEDGYAGDDF